MTSTPERLSLTDLLGAARTLRDCGVSAALRGGALRASVALAAAARDNGKTGASVTSAAHALYRTMGARSKFNAAALGRSSATVQFGCTACGWTGKSEPYSEGTTTDLSDNTHVCD